MHKTAEAVLSAAVATSGTFTVGYPDGYSAGDFENAGHHEFTAMGAVFRSPNDFTVSFGATAVTVTYNGTTTIPAQTRIFFQFNMVGRIDANNRISGLAGNLQTRMIDRDIVFLNKSAAGDLVFINLGSPSAADSDGICASQSVDVSEADAVINGALAETGDDGAALVINKTPRNVVASWTGTAVLIVQGYDEYGQIMEERSASGTSHTGTKAFKKITRVTWSADVTSATVGTGDVLGLPVKIPTQSLIVAEFEDGVALKRLPEIHHVPFSILEAEADAATSVWIVPGFAGSVLSMTTVVGDTVTTGGNLTVEIGGTEVDGLAVVIANSSSAGDVDTDTATAGHATAVFTATQALEIVPASAIDSSGRIRGYVECRRTSTLNGTFVAGLAAGTKSTATTADVRGTYDPVTAADSVVSYGLLAIVPDAGDLGNDQYYPAS